MRKLTRNKKYYYCTQLSIISGSVVVGSLTVSQGHLAGVGGLVGGINNGGGSGSNAPGPGEGGGHRTPPNNSGVCQICHKSFRQLRSHIADVHVPTPTPCPLCGKIFSSKHKMFGHKYRSCPNRTKNLVRHLELLDHNIHPGQQQVQVQQPQLPQQQMHEITLTPPPSASSGPTSQQQQQHF